MVDLTSFTDRSRAMTRDDYKALRAHHRELRQLADDATRHAANRMALRLVGIIAVEALIAGLVIAVSVVFR